MKKIHIASLDELPQAAKEFREAIGSHKVLAFHGGMGAGKTTFITAFCKELGIADNVSSPTFAIINEYLTAEEETVYHFDLYRLETLADVQNIGAEDYFYSGNLCLIEWPEIAEPLLPADTLDVTISAHDDGSRTITL